MTTIKDVAKYAGTSVATVSRVLNNHGPISNKMRDKIYSAIKELDYKPNELARFLYKKNTKIFGLIVSSVAHPFFSELTLQIEHFAYDRGYKILLCNSMYDKDKELDYLDMLQRHQVDGIILVSDLSQPELFNQIEMPVVSIERYLSDKIPCIISDNYLGGKLAANHLIFKGCKNIALISGKFLLNKVFDARYDGFIDVCKEKNVNYRIFEADPLVLKQNDYNDIIQEMFYQFPELDGVFATSDIIATEVMQIGLNYGKEPLKDYKLIGFDDIWIAGHVNPPLTTIHQHIDRLGQAAVLAMIKLINEEEVEKQIMIPVKLVERKTT